MACAENKRIDTHNRVLQNTRRLLKRPDKIRSSRAAKPPKITEAWKMKVRVTPAVHA